MTSIKTPEPAQLKGSLAAMRRAVQRARVLAQQTGTEIVVQRGGKTVRLAPGDKGVK